VERDRRRLVGPLLADLELERAAAATLAALAALLVGGRLDDDDLRVQRRAEQRLASRAIVTLSVARRKP
jgi:hypothetical protein